MKRGSRLAVVAFSAAVLMGPFLGAAEPASERTPVIARYEAMRYGMFIHYGMTTFLEKPFCSVGILKVPLPPAETYRPTKLDVDQWVSVAEKSGMRYVVLTAFSTPSGKTWNSGLT